MSSIVRRSASRICAASSTLIVNGPKPLGLYVRAGDNGRVNQPASNASVYVNGTITDAASAVVPVFDHGFLYGEGVYETLRTYHRVPFLLDRHLRRLRASASAIRLAVPLDDVELAGAIDATMKHTSSEGEQYIRLLVTRGPGELSYDPSACPAPTIVIIVKRHTENPPGVLTKGITVVMSSVIRNHPNAISPLIKSNNLLNNALAMQEAIRAGAQEAVMLNYRGEISECAQSNVFFVQEGVVHTPPLESGLLEGVTRNFLFDVGERAGVTVRETVLGADDLTRADEIFITSTTREVLPVTRVGNRVVGSGTPGPITRQLAAEFRQFIEELS